MWIWKEMEPLYNPLHKIKLEENKSVFLQWFLDIISSVYSFGVFLLLLALGLPVPFFFPL